MAAGPQQRGDFRQRLSDVPDVREYAKAQRQCVLPVGGEFLQICARGRDAIGKAGRNVRLCPLKHRPGEVQQRQVPTGFEHRQRHASVTAADVQDDTPVDALDHLPGHGPSDRHPGFMVEIPVGYLEVPANLLRV